jgi:two-component SAPR family response regulator
LIKAIIVDDEQLSIDKMGKLLKDSGLAAVKGKFTDPLEALKFLEENKVDAVFLDIEMPDMDGIELSSRILDLQGETNLVFVTAYNKYAVEAFRLNALDYLMKPVMPERLEETLHRIIEGKGLPIHSEEISVRCFGRFRVKAGREGVKFRTEKAEELLAFLISKRDCFISRKEILDTIWEDFDGDRALTHFNTTLHYVKKALLRYGVQMPITYDRGGYKFNLEALACDYLKFCTFIEKASGAGQENILEYEETAGLYKKEYLSGWECGWVEIKRLLLEGQFIRLLLEIGEYYKGMGNFQKAADWLKEGLMREPLHRELNYRLLEVLLLAHERMLAIEYYELYRKGLKKKLNQEPDDAFRKLLR